MTTTPWETMRRWLAALCDVGLYATRCFWSDEDEGAVHLYTFSAQPRRYVLISIETNGDAFAMYSGPQGIVSLGSDPAAAMARAKTLLDEPCDERTETP